MNNSKIKLPKKAVQTLFNFRSRAAFGFDTGSTITDPTTLCTNSTTTTHIFKN